MEYPEFEIEKIPRPIRSEDDVKNNITTYYFVEKKGTGFNIHLHSYDHTIICTKGSMRIYHGENVYDIKGGDPAATMTANVWHASENLEDGTEFHIIHPLGLM